MGHGFYFSNNYKEHHRDEWLFIETTRKKMDSLCDVCYECAIMDNEGNVVMNIRNGIMSLACALLFLCTLTVYGREVRSVKVEGRVSSFSIDHILRQFHGELSDDDMRRLGTLIENEYRRHGYSLAVVGRIEVHDDAVMVVYIHEPLLEGAVVRGIPEATAKEVERMLMPESEESYNRNILSKRLAKARDRFALDDVRAGIEITDSGNVFLVVDAVKARGRFYGGIGSDLFYGINPFAGYYYAFDASALDVRAGVGIGSGELRKADGDFIFYYFGSDHSSALFMELYSGMKIDAWETRQQQEYSTITVVPSLGYRFTMEMLQCSVSLSGAPVWIKDYRGETRRLYSDIRLNGEASLGNGEESGKRRDTWHVRLKGGGGYETYNDIFYADAVVTAEYPVFPVTWLRLVPGYYGFFTSSADRMHLAYVYNEHLLGFFGDYTAAQIINTAGLDLEFEVSKNYLFMGPFIDGSLFRQETREWDYKGGTGLRLTALYSRVILNLMYAWDITKNPSHGGVYFAVSGSF